MRIYIYIYTVVAETMQLLESLKNEKDELKKEKEKSEQSLKMKIDNTENALKLEIEVVEREKLLLKQEIKKGIRVYVMCESQSLYFVRK